MTPNNIQSSKWSRRELLAGTGTIAISMSTSSLPTAAASAEEVPAIEARNIAKEATIYGFPLVDNYRIQYAFFEDRNSPDFKAPWNTLNNVTRVFTPEDKAIQTPNSDTPYSQLGADLRAEPLVLSVPQVETARYYSLQFVDMYTHNFAFVGSRTTGNEAGRFLLAGPRWTGTPPEGIKSVIRCETEFAFVQYRTQLFDPGDIEGVKKVQAGYSVAPLSAFLGKSPTNAPPIVFPKPLPPDKQRTSTEFFELLNFVLQFCPTHPSEIDLMARLAKINIGAGKTFAFNAMTPETQKAVLEGMADAWREFAAFKANEIDTGKRKSSEGFGTREFLHNDYLTRMASAAFGIYGLSKEEALYPSYFVDSEGNELDGHNRYELHFGPGQLPPVNAFWSLTLYQLPSSLLFPNSINRYVINSPMLPELTKEKDGSVTLYLQADTPIRDKQSNWLPVPRGPFWTTLRLYWPKPEALDGRWQQPPLHRVAN